MLPVDKLKSAFKMIEEENWVFRAFLKGQDLDELDNIVNGLHKELFADYDCIACSNCCKSVSPTVEENEIQAIAEKLEATVFEVQGKYLKKIEEEFQINKIPCPFLTENGCSIYECRPCNCREYPYTNKEEIFTSLINLVQNCEICPVVYEIFERLKLHYKDEFEEYKVEYEEMWGDADNNIFNKKIKIGRNDICPCGSGKKYKKCCGK